MIRASNQVRLTCYCKDLRENKELNNQRSHLINSTAGVMTFRPQESQILPKLNQ